MIKINKNRIKKILKNNKGIFRAFQIFYTIICHPNRLMRRKMMGDNHPNETILIVRPNSEDGIQGLMSLFVQAVRWIQYADDNSYKVFIDYKNYKTQYYEKGVNAWEYFFEQPDGLQIEDVYCSKKIVYSGVTLKNVIDEKMFREDVFFDKNILNKCNHIISKKIRMTEEVNTLIKIENDRLHVEECIGVYIRGTDYAKLKPSGEFRQPDIHDVCIKTREFSEKYIGKKIFVVTEDEEYYRKLKLEFGGKICTVSYDSFITGYDGKTYLSKTNLLNQDKKRRGIDYLTKIILLSQCKYLISSITMGSIAAYCFNGGKYQEEYIFNLGFYD